MVSEASRMFSAISLGDFCRFAPSTRSIMRSMKLCPGRAVTRMTRWSERTLVPPVTPVRSPPDSRITGADSPVIADSSTLATPSTTSPSCGITSPAGTRTMSCSINSSAGSTSWRWSRVPTRQCSSRRAVVPAWAARSESACALPRASATASARLAKSTVSQSQKEITQAKTLGWMTAVTVVRAEPVSTTSITGLRTIARGFSLRTAAGSASASCRRVISRRRSVAGRAARGGGRRFGERRGTPHSEAPDRHATGTS